MTLGRNGVRRGVAAGHVDDRGYGNGACAGNTQTERGRAVWTVAAMATDAGDCELILEALGLRPEEGKGE